MGAGKESAAAARTVVSIVGTRPEAIKMAPLVKALAARPGIHQRVVLTGQHADLCPVFGFCDAEAIVRLRVDPRDRGIEALRDAIRAGIGQHLAERPPALVLVQGDTTSALAGALAARDHDIAIGHVEAGLRSFDLGNPFPEEANRVQIDALADLLFAPTEHAAANLAAEPAVTGAVHVTGNTGIDALMAAIPRGMIHRPPASSRTILVTCHRRENQGEILTGICAALRRLVAELPVNVVLPLHTNRHQRAAVAERLAGTPGITLLDAVEHRQMVALQLDSWAILTDSGGLQEEAPALGRPVLVLRKVTERVEAANAELVGTDPDAIVAAVRRLLTDDLRYARMARPSFPFGDGRAAPRIAALIEEWLAASERQAIAV